MSKLKKLKTLQPAKPVKQHTAVKTVSSHHRPKTKAIALHHGVAPKKAPKIHR